MALILTGLTSVAQCDARIQEAQKERFDSTESVNHYTYLISHKAAIVATKQLDLIEANSMIAQYTSQIDTMPAGPDRSKLEIKRSVFQTRVQRLTLELGESQAELDLERQIFKARAAHAIIEIDARIVALEARKVELQNAA